MFDLSHFDRTVMATLLILLIVLPSYKCVFVFNLGVCGMGMCTLDVYTYE